MKGEEEKEGVKGGGPPTTRCRGVIPPRLASPEKEGRGRTERSGVEVTRLYSVQDFSMIRPSADKLSGRDRGV